MIEFGKEIKELKRVAKEEYERTMVYRFVVNVVEWLAKRLKEPLYMRYRLERLWWRINPRITHPYIKIGIRFICKGWDFKVRFTPLLWEWGYEKFLGYHLNVGPFSISLERD